MNQELAERLWDAGYPPLQSYKRESLVNSAYWPSFDELVSQCEDMAFFDLVKLSDGWVATDHYMRTEGRTPQEAVANLWIMVNGKKNEQ